jgi:hypothetical protein
MFIQAINHIEGNDVLKIEQLFFSPMTQKNEDKPRIYTQEARDVLFERIILLIIKISKLVISENTKVRV